MVSKDKIICPTCQKNQTWRDDNPFRPFCSERCKLIDLGDWADEQHKIPGEDTNPFELPSSKDENDTY